MRLNDEDMQQEQADELSLEGQLPSLNPGARQLLDLLMRSQDLDDGDGGGEGGPNRGGSDDGSDDDAPVLPDCAIELDITARRPVRETPASPDDALGLPPEITAFCHDYNVDPSTVTLPDVEGPAADVGVSFDTLLAGEVHPISVLQVQLISQKTKVPPGGESHSLGVRNLALCGRLTKAATPAVVTRAGRVGMQMRIEDVQGEDVRVLVVDPALDGLPAAQVVKEVMTRFPTGTAIAMVGFSMSVEHDSFSILCDLADSDRAVHRLGAAELPPLTLFQVDHVCTSLLELERFGAMMKATVDQMAEAEAEADLALRPLLTSLAVAHLRLGADGLALAYATAALMVVYQRAPPVAACVAAKVLWKMGLRKGACAAVHLGHFPDGHSLEPVETPANLGVAAQAGLDGGLNVDSEANVSRAIKAGLTEFAQGLAKTEVEWLDHGLGDESDIRAAAESASKKFGVEAGAKLRAKAEKLFRAGSTAKVPLKNVKKVEDAIVKWRAALRLALGDGRADSRPSFFAWSVINSRYTHWKEAQGHIEPAALHYMDLATLTMMRGTFVNESSLRSNVYRGRCAVDSWESVLNDALQSHTAVLDIVP